MPDQVTEYLKANDNADDYAESLVTGLEQQRLEDTDNLLTDLGLRDEELWDDFGVPADVTIDDYEEEPVDERGIDWTVGVAGLATAANMQFFLDNRENTIIKPVAYREQVLEGFELTSAQWVQAGKRSTEFDAVTIFKPIRNKYLEDLAFLEQMSNKELYSTLQEYGALRPFDQQIADSMQYVSRMTTYPPGSDQWTGAVNDLIEKNSKRAIEMQNRRSVERIYSFRSADGDMRTLMVWIGELGGHTCQYCPSYYGEVRSYGEWIESGILPGASVCAGGDRCKCHLEAVGELAA